MHKLTEKERLLVDLIGQGMTNSEIADVLGIKVTSVGVYIHNLSRLVGAKNRIDLYNKLK